MRHLPEQRRESRTHNQVSGTVSPLNQPEDQQIASLRDLNTLGAFFYSDLRGKPGDKLALQMIMPNSGTDGKKLKVCCEGVIVRIEPGFDGTGTGFAVQFSRYDISWVQ